MRRTLLVLVGALVLAHAGRAAGPGTPAIAGAEAAAVLRQAAALCAAEGGRLWGRTLCGPMLLVDEASRQAVLSEAATGAVREGELYRLILPAEMGVANTAVELDGRRWTMLLWPLPGDPTERGILLMHESYHRIQPDLGLGGGSGLGTNAHLDGKDGRIWLRAELHALRAALEGQGEARRAGLADALACRARRRALRPQAAEEERALELNEGLAESTGIAAALPSQAERVRAAIADLVHYEKVASFVRSFAYATGPAYAELLSAVSPAWRGGVTRDFDLGDAAAAAYGLAVARQDATAADAALARHGGAAIVAEENARQREAEALQARLVALLVTGPTVTLPLRNMSISFDPRAITALGDHGSVYSTLEISDAWGTLKVRSGGALIPPSFDRVVVPLGATTSPSHPAGDGWTVTLAPGFVLAPAGDGTRSLAVVPRSEPSGAP